MLEPVRETAQHPFELRQLLALVGDFMPESILEVGVWHGGTLWHWLQTADEVVAVDNQMLERDEWEEWAEKSGTLLDLIQGDSTDGYLVEHVRSFAPFDMVFIDAAHDYNSVRADWENYGSMVEPGGLVVFHDIAPRPDYGVAQLWAEIKPGRQTVEIHAGVAAYCGIGVVFV